MPAFVSAKIEAPEEEAGVVLCVVPKDIKQLK